MMWILHVVTELAALCCDWMPEMFPISAVKQDKTLSIIYKYHGYPLTTRGRPRQSLVDKNGSDHASRIDKHET